MARKQTDLGPAVTAQIRAMMLRGAGSVAISAALTASGVRGASKSSIQRRMRDLQEGVNAERAKKRAAVTPPVAARGTPRPSTPAPPLPSSPDAIPDGTDADTFDAWLETAKHNADVAESEGDLTAFAAMGRLTVSLLEARRKATPLPKEDPNDRPDMLAARERARTTFHKLVDQAVGE